ncbi:SLATT domain-containing protein [Tessaracoccus antarcticus]|uniref:SLATT domain-containing protein n=1 Tax=Tessaracoccus antarcticus TaxID=2479848 RepID=A0A3M0FYM9_9ACTN|nr:SLATT domain-containing protein [Tessaracoccus antarcticus]RMB57821.1 SLATT domain-containing protein [Tessaracoccus antarcticus]
MTRKVFTRKKQPADTPPPEFIEVPANVPNNLIPVAEEISRVEESARHSAQVQFEAAKSWHYWNLSLGVPASVFGLLAGGAAFTEALPSWLIGTGALIGAALAGTMTVLGAERRATRAKICANTFHDIQDDARRLLTIDLATMKLDEAHAALTSLCDRYKETRQTADAPARRFYQRALRNLREGGQQFAIDEAKKNKKDSAPTPVDPPALVPMDPTYSANPNKEN